MDRAVWLLGIIKGEIDFEDTAGTAQILRLCNGAARLGAAAGIGRRIGFLRQAVGRDACRQQTKTGGQMLCDTMLLNAARKTTQPRTGIEHPRPRSLCKLLTG